MESSAAIKPMADPLPLLNRPRPNFNKAEDEIPKPNLTKENHTFEDPDGMVTNSPLVTFLKNPFRNRIPSSSREPYGYPLS